MTCALLLDDRKGTYTNLSRACPCTVPQHDCDFSSLAIPTTPCAGRFFICFFPQVLKTRPRCVPTGSTAHIRITSQRPICLEKYGDCRALGRFVLRQKGATVAVGLVLDTEIR